MKRILILALIFSYTFSYAQVDSLSYFKKKLKEVDSRLETMRYTELIQSMSQRSLLTPGYHAELKALIARQAYNFWKENEGEKYVSHLVIYSALYAANKVLGSQTSEFDSYGGFNLSSIAYNQAIGHEEMVTSLKFSNDSSYFYSAGSDGKVIRWDLQNIKNVPEVIYAGDHLINSIDISNDGKWLLIVTKKDGIMLMSLDSPSEHPMMATDPTPVQSAIFMPNELKYLVADQNGKVIIKDFKLGEKTVGQSSSKVLSLAVDENQNKVFAGTEQGLVHIWKDTSASVIYSKDVRAIHSLGISHNRRFLAMGDEYGEAIIWDTEKHKVVRRIFGHSSAITKIEFNPDDTKMLTSSRDGTVRVWDLKNTKKLPLVLDDHNGWVMTATFSPDGSKVISGSADKFIRVFPVEPNDLAMRICELLNRNLTQEEWTEYIGNEIPYQQTCPLDTN